MDVLPEIARAVKGRAEVFLDGGVRCGTDVFKALALGAKAVFIGRPLIWGLVHSVSRNKNIYIIFILILFIFLSEMKVFSKSYVKEFT